MSTEHSNPYQTTPALLFYIHLVGCPDGKRLASASWDRTIKLWEGGAEPAE